MKNLTWQNPEQLFVAQELINKVKSKCCGIKVQLERLKKAAYLFREGNHRINEVSQMVGFNSSSYFAQCFQKQFGMLPKEFVDHL